MPKTSRMRTTNISRCTIDDESRSCRFPRTGLAQQRRAIPTFLALMVNSCFLHRLGRVAEGAVGCELLSLPRSLISLLYREFTGKHAYFAAFRAVTDPRKPQNSAAHETKFPEQITGNSISPNREADCVDQGTG